MTETRPSGATRSKHTAFDPSATGYAAVINAFKNDTQVALPGGGKGFGSNAFKIGGKIFAMLSSRSEFVVRLSESRVAALVNGGHGKVYDPGHGRLMKSWLVVTGGDQLWIPLAKEARALMEGPAAKNDR